MEYTFREQDGMVQVCLNFSGPLKNDSYVELEITLIPNGADGKYICTQTLVESRKVIKQYIQMANNTTTPETTHLLFQGKMSWLRWDSNPRLLAYKANALPTELPRQLSW